MQRKSDYRKVGVKGARADPDAFGAMAEGISRRFARLSDGSWAGSVGGGAADARPHDASFAAAPNLVVIDGGKGQLSAALAALHE